MDTLRQFMDVGQSAAKLMYTVDPGYLRATMPALQDAAFVASLAWSVYSLECLPLSKPH